jgi:NADH-quinone oxidoreductase subunit M
MLANHLLSWLLILPVLGIGALCCVREREMVNRVALVSSLLTFGLSGIVWMQFNFATADMQFVERFELMPTLKVQYALGIDGISLLMVVLTTLLTPIAVLCSWNTIKTNLRFFMILILLLETATLGVFLSLDLVFFYIFWELTMVCAYFLMVLWGGPGRSSAGLKFVLYSFGGGLLLLLAILGLYVQGGQTFDLVTLSNYTFNTSTQYWLFLAFFLAFAIKVPMVPFHAWLPGAYSESPTAGSVILAGALSKMGAYGLLRICLPLFPEASIYFASFILWLSIAAIIYGGLMALAQSDLKKLVAYSSVSHMGFVTLGIFVFNSQGIQGAVLQMFNHGITTAALFIAVGQLYDRTHSRAISDYGGLHKPMPRFVALFFLFSVAGFGLPGTCNFIGEFLILVGTSNVSFTMVLISMVGIPLAAAYMLRMLQRLVLGEPKTKAAKVLPDLSNRELATLIPLAILVLCIGLYPGPLMEMIDASVTHLIHQTTGLQIDGISQLPLRP